jgi:multidrug resistance efflux pump
MSPSPSRIPEPQEELAPAPVPVVQRPARRTKWLLAIPIAAVAVLAAGWTWKQRDQPAAQTITAARTARVVRGALARTVRLTGTVSAKNYYSISAPILQGPEQRELVLIHLGEAGSDVKKDQVVGEIDGQSVADHLDDLDAQIGQMEMESRKLGAQHQSAIEVYRQRARAAKAAWDQAVLAAKAAPVRNSFDKELLQLNVEQAKLEYEEVERQIPLVEERNASERLSAKYREDFQISHRGRHRVDLKRFTMRSPIDGKLILKTVTRNGQIAQVQTGEQIAPGQSVLRVVDLSSMAVEATMSQTDSENIRQGQKARVHFDAYPDLILDGHVEAVGMLASSGRRTNFYVRRIPVRIAIDGRDSRVIPDLTAAADVILAEEDDQLLIPRDAVTESNGKPVVFVKQGEILTPREVEIGAVSHTQASIVSGLQAGEEIAVQPSNNN